MKGTIILIHSKYVVLNQKKRIVDSPILSYLLPNDVIDYEEINDEIHIRRLAQRKHQFLMAVVNQRHDKCVSIFSYGLPKFFNSSLTTCDNKKLDVGDILIIEATLDGMSIYQSYGSIQNRLIDKRVITDLYELNAANDIPLHYMYTGKTYYTKEFRDLTHLHTFNVDPTHSRDFDDAISIEHNKIYVHIVDANSMIPLHSEIENSAFSHAFTLYLPEHIQNILPRDLSDYELSLVKGARRNVITIEYTIDDLCQIASYEIYPSAIVIKERYDYTEFGKCLDKFPLLVQFNEKWKKGTLPVPHVVFDIDEKGRICGHHHETNIDHAHKIVETLMILTNLTVSKHIPHEIPHRFHSKVTHFDYPISPITDNEVVNSILTIKKYRNAIYDSQNKGHFGLNLSSYTHFTSPIRRYFDVILHRMLAGYQLENLESVLDHINNRERSIDHLVTIYRTLKILDYMDGIKNTPIKGYILSTTDKGVVVLLEDFLYETFVFTAKVFTVGEKVTVEVADVSWLTMTVKIKMI